MCRARPAFLCPMKLVGLVRKRSAEIFNLELAQVEVMATLIMGALRDGVAFTKLVDML